MSVPWLTDAQNPGFTPGIWQRSNNSGATYVPYSGVAVAQVAGGVGVQRYRAAITIPAGATGSWRFTAQGDLWSDSNTNPAYFWQIRYDGVLIDSFAGYQFGTVTLPATPGAHTLEVWVGAASSSAGLTRLDVALASGIMPCDCCPTMGVACAAAISRFSTVAETQAQAGWAPVNLAATIDGITATATVSGYNSPAGLAPTPTPQVTYTIAPARSRVRGLMLWNQGGNDLNDSDGLGPFTADFYAGATLLYSFATAGANGPAPQTLTFPPGASLNGVDRVVLRNLGKLSGSTVAPLWRELQLINLERAFSCQTPDGVLHWYDSSGIEVSPTQVQTCECIGNCCPPSQPEAQNSAWTIAPGGLSATKTVNGVTITATVVGQSNAGSVLIPGVPAGAFDVNALTLNVNGTLNQFTEVEFDASVQQSTTSLRLIDFDRPGGILETATFTAPHNATPSTNIPLVVGGGSPGGLVSGGPGVWEAPIGQSNRSATMTWNGVPWGGGNKVRVRFTETGPGAVVGAIQLDFSGPIYNTPCGT